MACKICESRISSISSSSTKNLFRPTVVMENSPAHAAEITKLTATKVFPRKHTSIDDNRLSEGSYHIRSGYSRVKCVPITNPQQNIWFLRNGPPPVFKQDISQNVLTIVFDLDETLVYSRKDGMVIPRPHVSQLLQLISSFNGNAYAEVSHCENTSPLVEIIVWTHAMSKYARRALDVIDPTKTMIRYCICQDETEAASCTFEATAKDLSLLGRNVDHIVIVENCPASVCHNPANAIIIPDFVGDSVTDKDQKVIPILMEIIQDLLRYFSSHSNIHSSFSVPSFLVGCPQLFMEMVPDDKGQTFGTLLLKCKGRSPDPFKSRNQR